MSQTIQDAMHEDEERLVHWSELEDAPNRCPPADYEPADAPLDHDCGGECRCDWYYEADRDDRNDGLGDDDLGLDQEDDDDGPCDT